MDEKEYEKMYKLEEDYWWFAGKRYLLSLFLEKYYNGRNDLKILDVGCGTGIVMNMLKKYGDVCGIDAAKIAIGFCHKRGIKNIKLAKVQHIPYKKGEFDIITCLDVLYHKNVEDDVKAMKEMNRVLKPNGHIFITDSAMMCLYGRHDLAHHGIRRYSKKELKNKLKSSGFIIRKLTYYNTLLFPIVCITRKIGNLIGKNKAKSDIQEINFFLNWLLEKLFKFELSFLRFIDYPLGVGIFCVAKKI